MRAKTLAQKTLAQFKICLPFCFGITIGAYCATAAAGPLSLSNNALEVVTAVEPNIVILTDDSGSMDWGVMTEETEGALYLDDDPYYYTHPDPGAGGASPSINLDFWVVPTEEHLASEGLAAPQGGVWRAWNHNYNKIYYNPNVTYSPWKGVDKNGATYGNVSANAAPYDPYDATLGSLDLTADLDYFTDCQLPACALILDLSGIFQVLDFYPARYYEWDDSNAVTPANDSNGVVDDDDTHVLVEIRATTPTYTRNLYNAATGKGRSDCADNGDGTVTCSYAQEIQNFANWFSYYRKRDLIAKAALSTVMEPIETARIGYATINNAVANNLPVASMNVSAVSGNKRALFDTLFTTSPSGDTALRSKLDQAGKYFECDSGDLFGSAANSAPGAATCPVQAAPAGTCQQNFTILMSDGFWNGAAPGVGNTDNSNGDYDGGAYGDTYSNSLADVAMHYYKRDLHGTLADDVSTTVRDVAGYLGAASPFATMHQHMATYTIGFGVNGSLAAGPTDPTVPFAWPDPTNGDPEKIDDLRHAAYNGRGQYLNANEAGTLASAFKDIITEIQAGTGTATAVAFNTQEVEAGTLVFRASFNTKTNRGDLVAQKINPDGSVDPNIQWSSAKQLDNKTGKSSDNRVIVTYKDTGAATSTGIAFNWGNLTAGAGSQQEALDSPQPANVPVATNTFGDERLNYLRGQSEYEGPNGDDGEFRARTAIGGKLGDIIHSTPVFAGKPQFTGRIGGIYPATAGETYPEFKEAYKNRPQITYTGANDGMLHAFRTSDGTELFAYVPNIVYPDLTKLTDPNYTHRFYVDLTPSINDVYITPASGTNTGDLSWNTILVGGLGAGGKGYYAINITNPDDLDTEAEAAGNIMWEFTEADDGGVNSSDLGYTFSQPLIAMSNAEDGSGNKRWVVIFGNGYNSTSADGDSQLYILFVEGGQDGVWTVNSDFYKVSTGFGKAESADGTTPNGIGGIRGIDEDANGTVDYIYAGDLQGNLYRFDMSSTTPGNWTAAPKLLFKARYKSNSGFPRDTVQPITTSPIVVEHPNDSGYIVITATGSWMTDNDATSTDIQSIYGIWDDLSNTPEVTMNSTTNQLVEQVFTNQVNQEHGYTVRTLTNNAVNWKNTGADNSKVKGWYIDLDMPAAGAAIGVEYPGERAVRNLQLRGGLLFVNTVIPKNTTACSAGTGGFELGFNPQTGGSGTKVIFDINNDGTFDFFDNVGDLDADSNIVTGMRFENGSPTDAAFIGNKRFTQEGSEIRYMGTNTRVSNNTGRTSWRELTP
jgi:type IV pilus assembly protein PilY1